MREISQQMAAEVHFTLGNIFKDERDMDKALLHYRKSHQLSPHDFRFAE